MILGDIEKFVNSKIYTYSNPWQLLLYLGNANF